MPYSVIGKPFVGPDALPKASGQAKFIDDLALPGRLFGRTLRCPHPHARILKVDTSRACQLTGVKAILTGVDLPPRKHGLAPNVIADRYPLARDRARYVGEEVAAVAAVDEDTAEEVLEWLHGHLLNPSFLDYKLPTALDTPSVEPLLVESLDPDGPYGAKEVGQGSLQAAAPAIANAVSGSAGAWLDCLPLTPEKVLAAMGRGGGAK